METPRPERTGDAVVPIRLVDKSGSTGDEGREGLLDTDRQILRRMCVRVGELGLLFPFDAGREVIVPPAASRIPNTASWLRGLANVRGTLVPVIDAAAAFALARGAKTPPYLLILGHGDTAVGLIIDGLPRLLDIDIAERRPAQPDTPTLLRDGVIAAYTHGGRVWMDIDLDILLDTLAAHVART